jgi:hypothetical protein
VPYKEGNKKHYGDLLLHLRIQMQHIAFWKMK